MQKVVLITGASNGIGEATALEYAKLGFKVAITGRKQERLDEVLEAMVAVSPNKSMDDFLALKADFEDKSQVEGIVPETVGKFGQLDVLINNAGYPGKKRDLLDEDFFEDFQLILQVNLVAATRLAQLATPHILKTKGVIIQISSIADRVASPSVSYSVSKAGMTMLSNCLANAFKGTGVRVVTVSPGPIITNFGRDSVKPIEDEASAKRNANFSKITLMNRLGHADEVAQVIVFLSSDKASYINGCTIDVDGGVLANFGGIFTGFAKPMTQQPIE